MAAAGNWCLIESDPGVFTELIRGFGLFFFCFSINLNKLINNFTNLILFNKYPGVTGVQVEELYTLDQESFNALKYHTQIFVFIFNFK